MPMVPDPRDSPEWKRIKQEVRRRDQYRCQACRWTEIDHAGIDLHVHHIKPVADGGTNDMSNLVTLCNRCHNRVHDSGPVDGEFPVSAVPDRPSYFLDSRNQYELKGRDRSFLRVLKENGPTQKKDIKAEADLAEWEFAKSAEALKLATLIGRVKRGVYAYIPQEEYERAMKELEDGKQPEDVRYNPYTPEDEQS